MDYEELERRYPFRLDGSKIDAGLISCERDKGPPRRVVEWFSENIASDYRFVLYKKRKTISGSVTIIQFRWRVWMSSETDYLHAFLRWGDVL